MAQCINELLQIEFDSETVVEGNLKKEVTDTVIKSCNLVQNFLKKCCIPQNKVQKNISSTCTFINEEDIDLKQPLSENCSQLNVKSTLYSKFNLCLPNYISEETIGRWCTVCLKETLYVAMFPCIMKLSHETDFSLSKKEKNSCSEEPFSCSGFESNRDVHNSFGNEKPSSEIDDTSSRFPLQGEHANVEDSLELTSVSKNGAPSSHFLDVSSLHGSSTTTSASSHSVCGKTMTSAVVKANALMDFCWQKLNTGNWKDIAIHWRQLYTWSCVVQVSLLLQCVLCDLQTPSRKITTVAASVAQVVRVADLGLLMGAPLESSPLALCASLLNSIARLSLSAQERGVTGQDRSLNSSEEGNLPDGVSLSGEKDFTAETTRDLPLVGASFVSKNKLTQKGGEPGKSGIFIKDELEYSRDKSALNGSKDFNFRKTRDLPFGTNSSGKSGEVVDPPQNTDGPQVNLLTREREFKSNTPSDNILVSSGLTPLPRLNSTSFSNQFKIMPSKNPRSTSHITAISCLDNDNETKSTKENFSSPLNELPFESLLRKKLCALHLPPVTDFYMKHFLKEEPVKLSGVLDFWPAMKKWSPEYLRRLAGARTVPIEVGARYTDSDWSQELVTLDTYITRYMGTQTTGPPGYLAQHQLLDQIPELLEDIRVPDYCHVGSAEEPRVNAWIGPKGTVSPLHQDPDHNILAQVVGYKYVRLYPASETPRLYPHPDPLLSNTSRVDVEGDTSEFPEFEGAIFWDMILRPGDSVYIPPKCWHYVRSLSVSFSVSFWWT